MAPAYLLAPVLQIGREIRFELAAVIGASRIGRVPPPLHDRSTLLPEQRTDDRQTVERRKAEAVLDSVRHGAVRR
jgi:hypothetical protein